MTNMAATNEKRGGVAKRKGKVFPQTRTLEKREGFFTVILRLPVRTVHDCLLLLRSAAEGRRPILPRW